METNKPQRIERFHDVNHLDNEIIEANNRSGEFLVSMMTDPYRPRGCIVVWERREPPVSKRPGCSSCGYDPCMCDQQ